MRSRLTIAIAMVASVALSATVLADEMTFTQMATFTSDLEDDVILTFPQFDDQGGTLQLQDVAVSFRHDSRVDLRADNDDPFKSTNVNGRMVRTWTATGPGVFQVGAETIATDVVFLDVDNGDGSTFDPTPPDGTDFGEIAFNIQLGTSHPDPNLYLGQGTLDYAMDVVLMINDLQFDDPPDTWQLEVENPVLNIETTLTYTFIPEPASLLLLLAGGAGLMRRVRRRA